MFDLIDECGKDLSEYGYKVKALPKGRACLAYLNVDSIQKSKSLGFDKGEYFILNAPLIHEDDTIHDYIVGVLKNCLESLIKRSLRRSRILIVGLGNPDVLADCLGKAVLDEINLNLKAKNKVFKICPNIYAMTGISTFDFVKMIRDGVKADIVLLIDSLATKEISRLATSFQITSVGLTAGSGVGQTNKKICEDNIGVPCIAIGVPLMYYAPEKEDLLLTPKDIHENVFTTALVIASAITKVVNV